MFSVLESEQTVNYTFWTGDRLKVIFSLCYLFALCWNTKSLLFFWLVLHINDTEEENPNSLLLFYKADSNNSARKSFLADSVCIHFKCIEISLILKKSVQNIILT